MSLSLHSALATAKNDLASAESWIFLIEVELDSSNTLYLARSTEQVTFDGQLYDPFPFAFGDITQDNEGNLVAVALACYDIRGTVRQTMRDFDFDGAPVTMMIVETGDLATSTRLVTQDFVIRGWSGTFEQVSFNLGHPDFFNRPFPGRTMLRTRCNHVFRGTQCGYSGTEPTCDRTLEGDDGCRAKSNQARFGGGPAIPRGREV